MLHAFMKEASKMESTSLALFVFQELNNFLVYYVDEAGFSDFADEPAENASGVAFFAWFDEA